MLLIYCILHHKHFFHNNPTIVVYQLTMININIDNVY